MRAFVASFAPALVASLLMAGPANAQTFDAWSTGDLRDPAPYASPQNAAVEFRIGPYVPKIDDEFAGAATPFEDAFGDKKRVHVAIEADWQALRIPYFGTLGPGFSIGYTKMNGFGLLADGTRASQKTSLTIIPTYAVAVLRADVLVRQTPVPLVPYVKLGVGYAMWFVNDGNDTAEAEDGTRGKSPSTGFQSALGIMLHLDPFDKSADMEMENTLGVNASYLFLEWYNSQLNGFGTGSDMNVGTSTWVTGLAWEM